MPGPETYIVLLFIALLAGVGITAIGPGGIFLTIALFALLPLAPPVIAGTASATFVVTGLLGSAMYLRSGELTRRENRTLALLLSAASVAGALAGTRLNPLLPTRVFGILLGAMAIATGLLIIVKRRRGARRTERGTRRTEPDEHTTNGVAPHGSRRAERQPSPAEPHLNNGVSEVPGHIYVILLGLGIGLLGALLGVGGPVLAVPALVVLGVPILAAVAVAQVQSVFVAAFATIGYAVQGAVSWPLALWVGVPQLVGALAGWWIARRTAPEKLEIVLGVALVGVGVYLLIAGA